MQLRSLSVSQKVTPQVIAMTYVVYASSHSPRASLVHLEHDLRAKVGQTDHQADVDTTLALSATRGISDVASTEPEQVETTEKGGK